MVETGCRVLLALLAVAMLPACFGEKDEVNIPWQKTEDGYYVYWYDRGTLKTGLSDKATLYAEFDAAIQLAADSMLAQYGTPRQSFINAAKVHKFHLHDHIFLVYHDIRVFGYHEDHSGGNIIGVAYWPYLSDPAAPDPNAPEWTHYWSTISDQWFWGVHDVTRLYPALRHEIGHHLYGGSFEHKAGQALGCAQCVTGF